MDANIKGLTLLELLFSVAIASLLLVLGVPSFVELGQSLRHKKATDDIEHFLNQSRLYAIYVGNPVFIDIQRTPWCIGASEDSTCNCHEHCELGGDTFTLNASDYPEIDLIGTSFSFEDTSQFQAFTGTAFGYNGSITLESPVAKTKVIVSALGRTRICIETGSIGALPAC